MLRLNQSRMNYLEKFQQMIDGYNAGSRNLVLDWRRRQQTKAAVKVAIEEALDQLPESYSTETYQHVYECYSEAGLGI
jgi:hypothetical protein